LRHTFADWNPVAHHVTDAGLQIEFHARII
jgi:hypothetical protein